MRHHNMRVIALAASLLATHLAVHAADQDKDEKDSSSVPAEAAPDINLVEAATKKVMDTLGIKLWGYMRAGFYGAADGEPKGQYQLGGDLQHYRLGNEGDTYIEFGIGKKLDLGGGMGWGVYYMPTVYNGNTGTAQIYTDISGLDFAPNVTLWAGQRYHRIQDIHILDNWLMEDGDNYGAGADNIQIGKVAFNVSVYTDQNTNNHNDTPNNAKRGNLQIVDFPLNPGGKLNVTAALVHGAFASGSGGGAFGLLHNQTDFLVKGLINSLFIQTSTGHASLSGKFYNLDSNGSALPGARQNRIVESINWQTGRFGGQALVGYETKSPSDGTAKVKDWSVGGRGTYGISRNTKLVGEVGITSRAIDGQTTQHLNKETVAIAFSPKPDFWSRPELRIYASHFNWNDAAAVANASTFAIDNRTNATTYGVQVEAWW